MGDQGQALAWLVPSGAHVTHGKSNSRSSSHEKVESHHHHHGSIEKSHEADIYLGLAKDSQSHRDKTAPTTKPSILVIQDDENDLPRKAWAHSPTGHQSESLLNDRDAPIIALKTFSRAHRPHPSNLSSHQKHDHSNLDYVNTGQHGYVVPVAGASSVNVDLELDIAHLEGRVRDKTKPRSASGRKIKSHKDHPKAEFVSFTKPSTFGHKVPSRNETSTSGYRSPSVHSESSHEELQSMYTTPHSDSGRGTRECVLEDLERGDTPMEHATPEPKPTLNYEMTMKYDLSALLKQPPQKRKILTDALKRKIRAAGKDALAFNRLLEDTRAELRRQDPEDTDPSLQPQDLFQAHKAEVEAEKDNQNRSYVPLKGLASKAGQKQRRKTTFRASDFSSYMASPENLRLMKETWDENRYRKLGEQPWLLGRLALSKQTSRFELPMDLRLLETMTPMGYLLRYCFISRRRKTLYKSTFVKADKDRDGFLPYKDLVKAIKEIHVNYITTEEINLISLLLHLDESEDAKYSSGAFCAIAAFSERLILSARDIVNRKDIYWKENLEEADFSALSWKLEGVNVNPAVMKVLEVL